MKTLYIQATKEQQTLEHPAPLTLEEMQKLVSGYIEIVRLNPTAVSHLTGRMRDPVMVVNEEGLLLRQPLNIVATGLAVPHRIFGDVFIPLDWRIE